MEKTWADYIFGGDVEGFVYLALKSKRMQQVYYEWPTDRDRLLKIASANKDKGDLYFCPSLFKSRSGKKSEVLGSWVSWVDLDIELKEHPNDLPEAGFVVASGSPGKTHRYWRAPSFQGPELTERRNLFLQQVLHGDLSGWDCNQLLRIPNTLNYKTKPPRPVKVVASKLGEYEIPSLSPSAVLGRGDFELLPFEEIILTKPLPKKASKLFIEGGEDRSISLTHFAFLLAEAGYTDNERYSLLTHADARWGKFKLRDDKELQLSLIIQRTRLEATAVFDEGSRRRLFTRRQLRDSPAAKISWIYEGIISTGGFAVIAGKQGVGKSQLALQLASDCALSRDFLGIKQTAKEQQTVCWFSLEMTQDQVASTVMKQTAWVAEDSLEEKTLEENVLYDPVGHAIYLEEEEGQQELESFIQECQPTGIVIDSLSASVKSSLKDDLAVRKVFDWIDRIRAKYKVWVVLITHPRKMPAGVAKGYESTVDDIYGDSIITQRPSAVCLLSALPGGQFEWRYIKARSTAIGEPLCLGRSESLTFNVEAPRILEPTAKVKTKISRNEVIFDTDDLDG